MIIQKKESIIVYTADRYFDLMIEPINEKLNFTYHNFLNNVLCIYGDQKKNGSIPVFWTKNVAGSTNRIPHESSTLTGLTPNQIYYILLINENKIPVEIPKHITSQEFLQTEISELNCELTDYCDGEPVINSNTHRNVILTQDSGYSYNIDIPISNLYPNTSYNFSIATEHSNWPAKLSISSGLIERSSLTNNIGYTSGIIRSVFSYIPNGSSIENSIPYSMIDTNDVFYNRNISSVLNLLIYSNDKLLIKDSINIKCDNCLPIDKRDNPIITLSTKGSTKENIVPLSGLNNLSTSVFALCDKLDPDKNYEIEFSSLGANWPCFIGPKNIFIKPQTLYSISGTTYGSGSVEAVFRFAPISNPANNWSNLPYNLDSFSNEKFIKQNIYNNLQVTLKDSETSYTDSMVIRGIDNIFPETQCVDKLTIKFDNSNLSYPVLTKINRPGSEFTLDKACCSKDQILNISISGACCGHQYNYYFSSSDPLVSIVPSSGIAAFGDGIGRVSCVYNLNGAPGSTIRFKLQDSQNNQFATDDIIIRCKDILL